MYANKKQGFEISEKILSKDANAFKITAAYSLQFVPVTELGYECLYTDLGIGK
jgi:hypothetical protein